ncbi:hypothetical protein EsDP_00003550 [Epichloe bromicola]|uniref:Uncharacterized protein n=1 Tax=Epichloe bromicola TaxID=79588 RepID=A0ABQ0CP31_9HYPO
MSDTTAVNQKYFNNLAPEYDGKFQRVLGRLEEEVKARANVLGVRAGGRLLDYACGTGLLSRALGPYLGQCIGIDISESMVEQYNFKAKIDGLTPEQRVAYVGNLVSADDASPAAFASPKFFDFDLAGVGMGFHHMDDCDLVAKRLVQRLRPGGVLFVVDFASHAPMEGHAASSSVRHHGFTKGRMQEIFERAGAGGNFQFDVLGEEMTFENAYGDGKHMTRRVFFARGERGVSA